jgi:hypothetical protein
MAYFRISHLACGQANIHSGARYQCVGSTLPQFVPYRGIAQRDGIIAAVLPVAPAVQYDQNGGFTVACAHFTSCKCRLWLARG